MPNTVAAKYKSPIHKVLNILERGRDTWKAKYREAKAQIKYLQNKLRRVEQSQQDWKQKAQASAAEVKRLKAVIEQHARQQTDEPQKKTEPAGQSITLTETPTNHSYSIGHVFLFLSLVLEGANGLRAASRSLSVVMGFLGAPLNIPSWDSGRLWLMRIGHYKLNRPKIKSDDWVWIIDFSIQLGKEKCLVILGVRQCDLPPEGQALRHEDMEPITLEPVKQANGTIVYQKLEEAAGKTGVPRAIVSDHGSDVKAGIKLFCQAHQETTAIYDITHKIALMLKHRLEKDECWNDFSAYANRLKKQLQQTELSHLTPPALRVKARYMNLEERIKWARNILDVLDRIQDEKDAVRIKFGGMEAYREVIEEWAEMHRLATTAEQFVSTQGLSQDAPVKLALHFRRQGPLKYPKNRQFRHELLQFMRSQAIQCRPSERLPGSSEVIESVFGKQKRLEGEQSKSGFTGLLLGIPAMVAELSTNLVKQALECTPVKAVLDWKAKHLEETVQAKRRQAFSACHAEQK
jgi:predicted RNA-binding protein with EMAP domain